MSWYSFSGIRLLPLVGPALWLVLFCDWYPATFGGPTPASSSAQGQLLGLVIAGLALGSSALRRSR
ncbi:MAG: hypothetical protein ACOX6T_06200 [Myxococcales bacterium]|jgi:hypothetical protein